MSILGFLPPLLWLAVVWASDRHRREPLVFVLAAFAIGAFLVTTFAGMGNMTALAVGASMEATAVVVAPLLEESLKLAATALLLFGMSRMDEPVDGAVYGASVGFGFAAAENVGYFTGAAIADPTVLPSLIVVRSFGTAVMHGVAAGWAGAAVSAAAYDDRRSTAQGVALGLVGAVGLHMTWNGSVTKWDGLGGLAVALLLLIAAMVVFVARFRQLLAASPHALANLAPPLLRGLHLPPPDPTTRRQPRRRPGPAPVIPVDLPSALGTAAQHPAWHPAPGTTPPPPPPPSPATSMPPPAPGTRAG